MSFILGSLVGGECKTVRVALSFIFVEKMNLTAKNVRSEKGKLNYYYCK